MKEEFNILVPNWDFDLYDSYWLAGTSCFRSLLKQKTEYFQPKWPELNSLEQDWEETAEQQFRGKQPEIMLQLIENSLGKDFFTDFITI